VLAPPPAPAPAVASPAPAPAAAAPAIPAPPLAADGGRIVLRAKADAWMQVRDRQGPVLLNRVLRSGETWAVPNKGQLLLTTGNAGGTEVLVDGIVAPSLGSDGSVRRDLPLDPDQLRDGKLPAPAAAPHPAPRQQ
jgi:cytoskeleton protein RodZ